MTNSYETGVLIGRAIRAVIIVAVIGFLMVASYANGVARGKEQQIQPIEKVSKKVVDKPKRKAHKVYIANEEAIPEFAPTGLIGPRD